MRTPTATTAVEVVRFACSSRINQSIAMDDQSQVVPNYVIEEERAYHDYFAKEVSILLRRFIERFPHHHSIQWTMKIGTQRQHDLNIEVKPTIPMKKD